MQIFSLIPSARWGLLGSAALALATTTVLAEAPVRSTQVSYARGGGDQNGYSRASVGLNYKFIRCDNGIHLAYSLDNKSVRVSDTYSYNGKEVMAAQPAPAPPTIALSGRVTEGGTTTTIATVSDGLAAPALGYGCFSGQTKRVGPVPAGTPDQVDAYLSSLIFTPSNIPQLLRNSTVESAQASAERAERQQLAADKAAAEQAVANRTEQARVQSARAQQAKDAKAIADAKQAEARSAEVEADVAPDGRSPASRQDERDGSDGIKLSGRARTSGGSAEPAEAPVTPVGSEKFLICFASTAYSPIYRYEGDWEAMNAWASKNGWTRARRWFGLTYGLAVGASRKTDWKYSTGGYCNLDDRQSIENWKKSFLRDNPSSAVLVPWTVREEGQTAKSFPSPRLFELVAVD